MADNFGKNPEKHEVAEKSGERTEKIKHGEKEIKETSKGFVEGVSEVVEGSEVVEFATGEVAEKSGEGKNRAPAGGGKASTNQAIQVKSSAPPTIEIMRIQVSTQVKNEIRLLEKEASKLLNSPGNFNPFKLNGIVAKIRELKDILASMAYATAETIKGWWMKYVKGITI